MFSRLRVAVDKLSIFVYLMRTHDYQTNEILKYVLLCTNKIERVGRKIVYL